MVLAKATKKIERGKLPVGDTPAEGLPLGDCMKKKLVKTKIIKVFDLGLSNCTRVVRMDSALWLFVLSNYCRPWAVSLVYLQWG